MNHRLADMGQAVATRQSQVQETLDGLDKEMSILKEEVERLEQRLSVVLVSAPVPLPPIPLNKMSLSVNSPLCPLAERITSHIERVRELRENVSGINQRCEC